MQVQGNQQSRPRYCPGTGGHLPGGGRGRGVLE